MNKMDKIKNDTKFMNIYEQIHNKYGEKLNEISGQTETKYMCLICMTLIVVTVIYVGATLMVYTMTFEFKAGLSFLPVYLFIVGIIVSLFVFLDIRTSTTNVKENGFFTFFNEKIVDEIIKGISGDLGRDDKIEDWLYNEYHDNFDMFRRRDYYVFINHFYGIKDEIRIEMFNLIEDTQNKSFPHYDGYLYSSSEINNNVEKSIEFSNNNKNEINRLDIQIRNIIKEFERYHMKYRVKVLNNRLMIAIDTGFKYYPFFINELTKPEFLYNQYKLIVFAVELTIKLNKIF